jgi:transposase
VDADLGSAALPDDPAALRALLAERDAALAERDAALAERDALLLNARLEIEKLKVQLAALRRDRYGRSSERLEAEIGQLEMLIGDLEEDQAEREAAEEERRRAKGRPDRPRRRPALRRPLPAHLPRETVLHEPVLACRCGRTDPARPARLGEDVTEVLDLASWCPPQSGSAAPKVTRSVSPAWRRRISASASGVSGNRYMPCAGSSATAMRPL